MKVAIFTDSDFDKVSGVTTSLRAALRYAPPEIMPRVYSASDLGDDRRDRFVVAAAGVTLPVYGDMPMYMPHVRRLLKQIRHDEIDLIHFTTPGPVGLAALFVAWRTGLHVVGSFHTDLAACAARLSGSARLGAWTCEYLRWMYSKCDRILVPSESTRQLLVDSRIDARKLALWTQGVDTALFSPDKRSPALRERWHVCERRPAAIYVGRISREKGVERLPAFQSVLHKRGVEHRLIVVGDGPSRSALQEALPDAVFTGTLRPSEVATALASADVLLFPSDTDVAANVVLESQACGLPVVVSSGGGTREYVRPNVTGLVCPAADADAFGDAIAQLFRDSRRRDGMARAARAHALTLGWERALEPLYRAYLEVAARGRVAAVPPILNAGSAHGNATA